MFVLAWQEGVTKGNRGKGRGRGMEWGQRRVTKGDSGGRRERGGGEAEGGGRGRLFLVNT